MELCPYCFAEVYPTTSGFYCANCSTEFPQAMAVGLPELVHEILEIEDVIREIKND